MPKRKTKSIPLYLQIIIGMLVGILLGLLALPLQAQSIIQDWIIPWGHLFIKLLQLIAVPLVFFSLVKGVTGLQDVGRFSNLGGKTILIYLITSVFAVLVGLGAGLTVKPGELINRETVAHIQKQYKTFADEKEAQAEAQAEDKGPLAFLDEVVPSNIVSSMSDNSRMLQVIFFALFLGVATITVPREKVDVVVRLIDGMNEIVLRMVDYIIRLAPWGVAALMAGLVVDFDGDASVFSALAVYALTVVGCLFLFILFFYPLIIHFFSKLPAKQFMKFMYPVQLFAFTTSSSAATLPFTMKTIQTKLGVSETVTSFVCPIGATINMDGTSCYQTIAILFIAQSLGVDLNVLQLLTIVLMTVLSSIGTPSIPGGSYVILAMVLTSVGIPAEGLALIIGIDRPLDMLRTSVNVTGDALVCCLLEKR
ncbi:MAG: dicarboxylate/amino acid:cation symporter [Massilibacteroides sp.]|nr:dicarboxylate/amino acid:cation symporter [Massilibacteroides sp.]MDD3061490.1 dicarboxylate/amino acid:cation symporter [Massilibacteroides sp.]MDD4115799.1 dicarboxylate/amino acid:cation symporter [Massilibacteroides sp.]MDD4659220.1 dicarboxylate/amino acid:cation symporter [Massilibacteroides sp.]